MRRTAGFCLFLILIVAYSFASNEGTDMNDYVLKVIKTFPTDGTHQYWWPKGEAFDGATSDVFFLDVQVMRGDPDKKGRCYCCGLTLQVFYETLNTYQKEGHSLPESRLTPAAAKHFKYLWFCPESKSPGPVLALEQFGLGKRIEELDNAKPGDFIQFWRNNGSGHSVIFAEWVRNDDGEITALKYWSTQKGTNGIGYQTEPVGDDKRDLIKEHIYIGRLLTPESWQKPE